MRPQLLLVTGPPGSGKTSLARALASAIPCPVISRDAIREGLVLTSGPLDGPTDHQLALRTNELFFGAASYLLANGVSLVLEAAFQHPIWAANLQPLQELADIRIIRCAVDPAVARSRIEQRLAADPAARAPHNDAGFLAHLDAAPSTLAAWEPLHLDLPTLVVDTSDDYSPALSHILRFAHPQTPW